MAQLPLVPDTPPSMEELRRRAHECHSCRLHKTRKNVVFGEGNTGLATTAIYAESLTEDERINQRIALGDRPKLSNRVPIAFVGEAPGSQEDLDARPFLGASGQLLNKMIEAMRFERADVFVCYTVCCRPPGNKPPELDELKSCNVFLEGQLRNVNPKVIVALGATPAKALINTNSPVGQLRGRWWSWHDIPVRVTYHPAALLQEARLKKAAWQDLIEVVSWLDAAKNSI